MDDITVELNEAFAVQVLYCRDHLGIPNELMNVNEIFRLDTLTECLERAW